VSLPVGCNGDAAKKSSATIVGTATFPAVGVVEATHPSLGTGAMIEEDTLLAITLTSLGLLIAGNLVAAGPGALAARTPAATALRAE